MLLDLEVDNSGAWGRITSTCPSPAEAGSVGRWTVTFDTAQPLPAGARLALARRWPSDWGVPQASDPGAADFFTVRIASGAPARWWTMRMHRWHPFDHVLFVETLAPLAVDDRLELCFGDASAGSPGARVQTFIEEASPLSVRLAPGPEETWKEIAALKVPVVGSTASAVVASAPSRVAVGERFTIHVRIEDAWGNPASDFDGVFDIEGAKSASVRVCSQEESFARVETVLREPGVHRLHVRQRDGDLAVAVNPIVCEAEPAERLYWGDLHGQLIEDGQAAVMGRRRMVGGDPPRRRPQPVFRR